MINRYGFNSEGVEVVGQRLAARAEAQVWLVEHRSQTKTCVLSVEWVQRQSRIVIRVGWKPSRFMCPGWL